MGRSPKLISLFFLRPTAEQEKSKQKRQISPVSFDEEKPRRAPRESPRSYGHTCLLYVFLFPFASLARHLGRPPPAYAQLPKVLAGPFAGDEHRPHQPPGISPSLPAKGTPSPNLSYLPICIRIWSNHKCIYTCTNMPIFLWAVGCIYISTYVHPCTLLGPRPDWT